jgi:hypothetical protein
MLKNIFVLTPEQLESMKGGVNKKTNIDNIAPGNNMKTKQKGEAGPPVDIKPAAAGTD